MKRRSLASNPRHIRAVARDFFKPAQFNLVLVSPLKSVQASSQDIVDVTGPLISETSTPTLRKALAEQLRGAARDRAYCVARSWDSTQAAIRWSPLRALSNVPLIWLALRTAEGGVHAQLERAIRNPVAHPG